MRNHEHTNYCQHRLVVRNEFQVVTWEGSAWVPWGSDPRYQRCQLCEKIEYRGAAQEAPKHGVHLHTRPSPNRRGRRWVQPDLASPIQLDMFNQLPNQEEGGAA